jgi:DNA-binding GntR family transcriptional regulator
LRAADAQHTFPVLAVVHGLATELAVPRLGDRDFAQLHEANDAFMAALRDGDRAAVFAADHHFHGVFVATAGNPQIVRTLTHLTPALHRMEHLTTAQLPGGRSVAQHQAIVGRAMGGDAGGAASAVRANWMTLAALVERALA